MKWGSIVAGTCIRALLDPKVMHVAIPSEESYTRNRKLIGRLHLRFVERERYDPKTGEYQHSYPKGAATVRAAWEAAQARREAGRAS